MRCDALRFEPNNLHVYIPWQAINYKLPEQWIAKVGNKRSQINVVDFAKFDGTDC